MTQKKVGRPKHLLKEQPEYLKKLDFKPDSVSKCLLESIKQLETQLRAGQPRGIPTQLLAELVDFEDFSQKEQELILEKFTQRIENIRIGQQSGAAETQENAQVRYLEICKKNKSLISQIKPNGRLTINSVAKRIRDEWEQRGAGEKVLSINTLSAYIKKYQQSQM